MNELILDLRNEFQIKVEKINDFEKSFFKDIYTNAARCVEEITRNTKDYYQLKHIGQYNKDKEEYNNIIAFIGERGTGKSSAMISFAESLRDTVRIGLKGENLKLDEFNKIKKYQYVNLDIIDPSLFEDKESIFEIIIAKMFAKFKKYVESKDADIDVDAKRKILKSFQKVYESLRILNMDRKDLFKEDGYSETILETLSKLASSSNLRDSFINLVNEFLEVMNNDIEKKENFERFLVIAIDDLDMNIRNSAEMVEQIRKYLLVPNVIVLMAVKIEQLSYSLEQSYRKNYEFLLETEDNNKSILMSETKSMAYRYIEKLIPNGRKLYLPAIRTPKVDGKRTILKLVDKDNVEILDNDESSSKYTIEEKVLQMTFNKTGLMFIKPEYDIHYLVPDNLRELQNYLTILNKLCDISDETNEETKLYNVEKFEEYFLNTWVRSKLEPNNINIINEINIIHNDLKNKFVVNKIIDKLSEDIILDKKMYWLGHIKNKTNNPFNISIGDVLAVIKLLRDYDDNIENKKFIFAIKTIYSITMLKLTINKCNIELSKILGGNVFDVSEKFLSERKEIIDVNKFDKIKIDGNTIDEIINRIIDDIKTGMNSDLQKENIRNLHLIEWLHYFIYLGKMDENYRELPYTYYDRKANYKTKIGVITNARFNILSFIFNSINPYNSFRKIFNNTLGKNDQEIVRKIRDYSIDNIINCNFIIPVYNMDILEILSKKLSENVNLKYKDYLKSDINKDDYFRRSFIVLLRSIKSVINEIYYENDFLGVNFEKIINEYENCNLINFILSNQKPNDYIAFTIEDIKGLINQIYLINNENESIKELENFRSYFHTQIRDMKPRTQIEDKLNKLILFCESNSINGLKEKLLSIKDEYNYSSKNESIDLVTVKVNVSRKLVDIIDNYLKVNGE